MEEETTGSNSEALETSITHSWILLDTNEPANPIVQDGGLEKIEEPAKSRKIKNISDYSNNKSDTESDGISIISENEFYQTRNEDDSSTNVSDENTVDNCTTLEPPESQSESFQMQRSLEISAGKKESKNTSTITEEDDEKKKQCLISNRQAPKHDRYLNFLDDHLNIGKPYIIFFVCTILLAIIVSCISSKNRQSSVLEENKIEHNGHNLRYDEFLNSHIHEYCKDIPESTDNAYNAYIEKCLKNLMGQLEVGTKGKISEKQDLDSENIIQEPDIIHNSLKKKKGESSEKYHKIKLGSYLNEKLDSTNKSKMVIINRNKTEKERIHKQDRRNSQYNKEDKNDYTFNTPKACPENKLLHGKRKQIIWKKHITKEDLKLLRWRDDQGREEYKLNKKIKTSHLSDCNKESYPKKNKLDKNENKKKYKKTSKYKSEFDKKIFKIARQLWRNGKNLYQEGKIIKHGRSKKIRVFSQGKNESTYFDNHTIIKDSWSMNLVQARNDIRKKGRKARWWFIRVNLRKNKRNKAYWYFEYMLNRKNLRYDQHIQ
ncbi:uncharacterized protein LOC123686052 [Harmonia axyridis]|uniref:uncharacterized protein LOC123686052 n=1 Tax=Harmonia axyridis TaxID=115357 RepID=UPI001E274E5F|nr:uncharacterized protein LOC123686052 [Harmonia axyridis]